MNPGGEERLFEIFINAVGYDDEGAREKYLREACSDDPSLLNQVRRLISAEAEAGLPQNNESSNRRIGSYKLLQQIGEGGCGVVYMAEQEDPVRRKVALKIIKLGMDTKQVVARFEAERQALALMDHPNIARVFDGGATETGRPYFVMELVRGIKMTEYCDEHRLSTRQRLELFIDVCQAVQHAHQKGIIHRDLKPSNILLTELDGRPIPKIIDFGIAKAIEGRLVDQTLFTAFEQFLGTPAYMSPEQASLSAVDVDTRSDIYSLGVLLYELLTGATPFDTKRLIDSGLDEIRKTIQETEPPRPSTRLGAFAPQKLHSIARCRECEPGKLIHLIQRDLDWIVMKCLEKDRHRRYETANGLAMDVQRLIKNEPIIARPPTIGYRVTKFVRRNKFAVASGFMIAITLLLGMCLTLWQYVEKSSALERVTRAEQEQSRLKEQARTELHTSLIYQARFATRGRSLSRRDLAVKALQEAAEIEPEPEMVQNAITALAMIQVKDLGEIIPEHPTLRSVAIDPQLEKYFRFQGSQNSLTIRSIPDHRTLKLIQWREPKNWHHAQWFGDAKRIAAYAANGRLELWDSDEGKILWEIAASPKSANNLFTGRLAFDATGERIGIINASGSVDLIDAATGRRITSIGPKSPARSADFHPHRNQIAIGTAQGTEVFDLSTNQSVAHSQDPYEARLVKWSPDGKTVCTITSGQRLRIWNPIWGEPAIVPGLGGYHATACYSPDGEWIADSDNDGLLVIRNGHSLTPLIENLIGFPQQFDPKGRRLVCQVGAGAVHSYEISPSDCYLELEIPYWGDSSLPGIAISPDDRWLATSSYSSCLYLWDLNNPRGPIWSPPLFGIAPVGFNSSGNQILAGSEKGIWVWDWKTDRGSPTLSEPELRIQAVVRSSRRMTPVHSHPPRWMVPAGEYNWAIDRADFSKFERLPGLSQETAALSPDGRWLVEGSYYSELLVTDLGKKKPPVSVATKAGLLSFSPDGNLLMVARAGRVEARKTGTWDRSWTIETRVSNESSGHCVFRPQGDLMATLASPTDLILVRPSDGKTLVRLVAPRPGPISRYRFSDSGRILAASTEVGRVQIWRLDVIEQRLSNLGLDWHELSEMPQIVAPE